MANWRPNVTVTVESVTTLPVSLAHDGCMCIHPETDTKGCEEERLSRRDKNVSEVSSFYDSQNYSHQPTAHSDSSSIPSPRYYSATIGVCSLKMNDALSLLSRSVYMCTSLEMTSILLHTTHILAGSILFISPPRPIIGANLRSPPWVRFLACTLDSSCGSPYR